jgi:hypothetical protein
MYSGVTSTIDLPGQLQKNQFILAIGTIARGGLP